MDSKMIEFLQKEDTARPEILGVRTLLLHRLAAVLCIAGFPVAAFGGFQAFQRGQWSCAVIYLGAYSMILATALCSQRLRLSVKAYMLILALFLIAFTIMFRTGLSGIGLPILIAASAISAALLGIRAGVFSILIGISTMVVLAIGMIRGLSPVSMNQMLSSTSALGAITTIIVFLLVTSVLVIFPFLVRIRLENSLDLAETHAAALENANRMLQEEINAHTHAEATLKESEAQYRDLVESANSIILRLNPAGTITYINEYAEKFFGYTQDEIIGVHAVGTIVPEQDCSGTDLAAMIKDLCHVPEQFVSNENENMTKSGTRVWIAWTNKAVYDSCGQIREILCIGNDITDRKKTEEALHQTEERFRAVFESAEDSVFIKNCDYQYVLINPAMEKLLEMPARQIAGKTDRDFLGKGIAEEMRKVDARVLAGETLTTEHMLPILGDHRHLHVIRAPMYNDRGHIVGLCGIARDLTETKKMEARLTQAQKMEAVGTLAGGIAHDFNNLLMGIQGHVSLALINLKASDPVCERLSGIEDIVKSGANLTGQLLGFARGGKYDVRVIDINELLTKVCDMFGRTKKEITIHKKFSRSLHTVKADANQIEQVFLNLLVNAWQAMPGGGYLYIETENIVIPEKDAARYDLMPGRYIKINVTDSGVGMDQETKRRIFEPFFTTKEMGRGTGLGLATVYGIVKGHGGNIEVSSEKGYGTSFDIYLPSSEAKPHTETNDEEEVLAGDETILLVDDETMILEIGRDILESMGYTVFTAANGTEALSVYKQHRDAIHLVLLDMIMPDICGGEVFDHLLQINPDVAVILCSGYSLEGNAQDIMSRGCKAFIQKPFSIGDLSAKIREVLDNGYARP